MSLSEKLLRNYIRKKLEIDFLKESYILDDDFMDRISELGENICRELFERLEKK